MNAPFKDDLVLRFKTGDKEAFNSLFDHFFPAILAVVERIVKGPVAEEITADVFVKLWKYHGDFESLLAVRKWLHVVARRDALNGLRTTKLSRSLVELKPGQVEDIYSDTDFFEEAYFDALSRIKFAVGQLPEQQQAVIRLSFFEGLKNEEIAALLGISIGTVKNHKSRGVESLRKLIPAEHLIVLYALVVVSS